MKTRPEATVSNAMIGEPAGVAQSLRPGAPWRALPAPPPRPSWGDPAAPSLLWGASREGGFLLQMLLQPPTAACWPRAKRETGAHPPPLPLTHFVSDHSVALPVALGRSWVPGAPGGICVSSLALRPPRTRNPPPAKAAAGGDGGGGGGRGPRSLSACGSTWASALRGQEPGL